MRKLTLLAGCVAAIAALTSCEPKTSGNPIAEGWYADPHAMIYGDTYWVYPTNSLAFHEQKSMDCFSSKDLITWTKHERIISTETISWAKEALWAPAAFEKDGKYYLIFGANNIPYGDPYGGIGIAVADTPEGPFTDHIGAPLISTIANNAQPIDQCLFEDVDGSIYMYYGGWGHCNVVKLTPDLKGIQEFEYNGVVYNEGGSTDPEKVKFLEVTPRGYTEGSFIFMRGGKYYFMWSEGAFTNSSYNVAYAISDSPFGPFNRIGAAILRNETVGNGAGHHSVVNIPGTDEWYFFYHRRPSMDAGPNDRVICVEKMTFAEDGKINPVAVTAEGVEARPLK
ncbi:MAG: glycoside hydrolase family 43 protein [Rikenellaceae bacterium]|nr:glycoside hydrolase family 43 protein [Rikenellaceae bacterium]